MKALSDLPELDWTKVDQNIAKEGFYMFGGQNSNGDAVNDLWILEADHKQKGFQWVNRNTMICGSPPDARFDHTMDRLQELLVIVGGRSKTAFIDTVYTLDLEKLIWT